MSETVYIYSELAYLPTMDSADIQESCDAAFFEMQAKKLNIDKIRGLRVFNDITTALKSSIEIGISILHAIFTVELSDTYIKRKADIKIAADYQFSGKDILSIQFIPPYFGGKTIENPSKHGSQNHLKHR